ncbi:MAG: four helix bundle protein [Clostridia bacterium]|nr:four helix bundle protein [Clostridia bacterium]MBQ6119497.1 four helix bundle protein [Clostridia bacterium]
MSSENALLELSIEFAVAAVELVDSIKFPKSGYMLDQFARSATSVGANIHEAQYAQGRRDFVSKLEIALKEANEASYWLTILLRTKRITQEQYNVVESVCGRIKRMLIASCRTVKDKT